MAETLGWPPDQVVQEMPAEPPAGNGTEVVVVLLGADAPNLAGGAAGATTTTTPVGQDTLVPAARPPAGYTVIFDPQTPEPGQDSRLGGLPTSRIYLDFELPEVWEGLQLKGSTINAAALVLRPKSPPPDPFRLGAPVDAITYQLLADPFEFGPKTPIGGILGPSTLLDPVALAEDGAELVLSITPLALIWSFAPPDSLDVLRIGIQSAPEGADLGFWSFGSAEDVSALRPSVRMIVTPRVPFRLP